MTELHNRIIETLIFDGPTLAGDLADTFGVSREEIVEALNELKDDGQVAPRWNRLPGDAVCSEDYRHRYEEVEDEELGSGCEEEGCFGFLVDDCRWRYCGGPVSEALRVA